MLRIPLTAGVITLCLSMPAFAQGSMPDTSGMSCHQIMEKVKSMHTSAPGGTMALARKQMIKARAAKAKNDEAGCIMHATKALQISTYRS